MEIVHLRKITFGNSPFAMTYHFSGTYEEQGIEYSFTLSRFSTREGNSYEISWLDNFTFAQEEKERINELVLKEFRKTYENSPSQRS